MSIVYMLTDRDGRPIAVAHRGNTADPTTIPDQVAKLRTRFHLERVILAGIAEHSRRPKSTP